MTQLVFPGFEKEYSIGELHKEMHNPGEVADYFEGKGFRYLEDLVAGGVGAKHDDSIPYIPYRIKFPSGRTLDIEELYDKLELPLDINSREEIAEGFYYVQALYHEHISDKRKFTGNTFLDDADEKATIEKYSKVQ